MYIIVSLRAMTRNLFYLARLTHDCQMAFMHECQVAIMRESTEPI